MPFVKFLAPITLALVVIGCGGGSDVPKAIAPVPTDQSPVGLWEGTMTVPGGAAPRGVLAAIAPDGEYTATIAPTTGQSDGRLLRGNGTMTSRNQLGADGTAFSSVAFPLGGMTAAVTITGTVTTGATINGTYSAGGETGTLSLTYRALTNNASALATASGTYTALAGSNSQPGTVNITTGGAITWNSMACTGNGLLSTIDTTKNIYRWTMEVFEGSGGCTLDSTTPLEGLAWLAPHTTTGDANRLIVMHGTRSNAAYIFLGNK